MRTGPNTRQLTGFNVQQDLRNLRTSPPTDTNQFPPLFSPVRVSRLAWNVQLFPLVLQTPRHGATDSAFLTSLSSGWA